MNSKLKNMNDTEKARYKSWWAKEYKKALALHDKDNPPRKPK